MSFVFCVWATFGYTSEDLSNANSLADQGIVTKQTTASKYRLDDKILRQEVIAMALKVKWVALPENYKCKKYFADATKSDWICRAVELAADNGIITRSNKKANPGKYVTRAEALAMMMKADDIEVQKSIGMSEWFGYYDKNGNMANDWQSDVLETARILEIMKPTFTTETGSVWGNPAFQQTYFKYYWRHNDLATRAEVFGFTKNIPIIMPYNKKPIMSCYTCDEDETVAWNDEPCCEYDFQNICSSRKGILRFNDMHPAPGDAQMCYQKAPDTWKACSIESDCLSWVCDLEYATTSGSCTLTKKEFSGENDEFYTATYSCTTPSPGVCREAPEGWINPGGFSHSFMMNDKILTEVLEEGAIF